MLKDHRQALAALQEQLLALKAQLGDAIKLRKGTGDDVPFPLHLLVTVAAPAAAASYDLSQLVLDVVISKQLFSSPEGALTVSVQQRDLPAALAPHISQQLQQGLAPLPHEVGPAIQQLPQAVGQLLRTVQQQFVQLISSLPHLIEPYESVDAAGATVRRYALVDSSEPSGTTPEEPSSEPSSTAAAAAGLGASGSAAAAVTAAAAAGSSGAPSAAAPAAVAVGGNPPPIRQHSHAPPAGSKQEVIKEHGSKPVAAGAAAAAPEGDIEAAASVPPSSSGEEVPPTSGQPWHPSEAPEDLAAAATSISSHSSTSISRLRPLHPGRPPVRPNAAIPGLPPEAAAAQDIAGLVRRYGAAFQLKAASAADTMYAVSSSRGRGSRRAGSAHSGAAAAAAAGGGGGGGGLNGGAGSSGASSRGPTAHSDAWLYEQLSLGSVHRFSLMLVPTDPDWAPRGPCHITGRVEADKYPQPGCCELQVHANSTLPAAEAQQLQRQLQQQLQATWGRSSLLLGVVRWAENYAAAGLQPKGLPQQQQQRRGAAREGSLQLPSAAERQQALGAATSSRNHSRSSSSCSSYSDGGYVSGSSSGSEAGGQAPRPGGSASSDDEGAEGGAAAEAGVGFQAEDAGAAASSGPGGFALQLEGLQLDNIGVLQVHTAQLQVQCTRCSSSVTVSLSAAGAAVTQGTSSAAASSSGSSQGFQWAAPCATCQQQQVLQLRPKMVHEMNNTLASCKVAGCRPVDLLPSLMAAQCAECSAVTSLRGVHVGRPASRNCPHCHRQLSVVISYVSIVPRGPPGAGAGGRGAGAGRAGGDGGRDGRQRSSGQERLVPGQPLPDYGTCKHYRHSHRWLRFPCCGRRFACDLCHEEGVEDGHPVAWASRMVCGYCSREQAVAAVCIHCGKKLASSASNPSGRNTRFWEGGQGCRDVRRLNRNDPHKHAGRGKTRSAKGSRVGPKAWSGTNGGTQQRSD